MHIAIFGAAGRVGQRIVHEALARQHEVTAVVRKPAQIQQLPTAVQTRLGDAGKVADVVQIGSGQDVVINATRSAASDACEVHATTRALLDGLTECGVRLLIVGGAATLVVPDSNGRIVLDDVRYLPPAARQIGIASQVQYQTCQAERHADWTYLSPPADLTPGERTGHYRLGRDQLLLDDAGRSHISMEDLAVALLDEVEQPRHHRTRFTAAY